MKIDKHFDPTDDLERELLQELDDIAKQLRGKITYSHYGNSEGKTSKTCLLYTSPSPRDRQKSRMPSSA